MEPAIVLPKNRAIAIGTVSKNDDVEAAIVETTVVVDG